MSDSEYDEITAKIEAILFSYGDWVNPNDIMDALNLDSQSVVMNSLKELEAKYREGYSYVVECHVDDGRWRMALKPEYDEVVSDLVSGLEIPKSTLKVLSVIAYEQPVTKTRLSEILGRSVKSEVAMLYNMKFVNYEKNGIGKYYKLTKKFYDYFKLDEDEDFRTKANENLKTYLDESLGAVSIEEVEENQNDEIKQNELETENIETNDDNDIDNIKKQSDDDGIIEEIIAEEEIAEEEMDSSDDTKEHIVSDDNKK